MKHPGYIFLVAGAVLATLMPGPARAESDTDALLDLLRKKGIITQEEVEQLSTELDAPEKPTQNEIKSIAREEAKQAVKPFKGLENLSIGGLYFLEWRYTDSDQGDNFNEFSIDRAYFTLKYKFNDWFSSRFTTDVTYKEEKTEGWELRLKYAYGVFDTGKVWGTAFRLRSEVGLVHTASDNYDAATWPYRCEAKNYLDRHKIQSSADYGVNAHLTFGELDKEWQKRVTSKLAAKWGGIWMGLYNGPGYTNKEENSAKNWEVLVYARPLNMIDILKGFRLGYMHIGGESNSELTPGLEDYPDYTVNLFMADYQHEYFTLMAQLYRGDSSATADDNHNRDGYNVAALVKMPFNKRLVLFGRYDVYDPNTDAELTVEKITTLGCSYNIIEKNLMLWSAIEDTNYEANAGEEDHTDYMVGLQIKF